MSGVVEYNDSYVLMCYETAEEHLMNITGIYEASLKVTD
jgi:hypothetical protein